MREDAWFGGEPSVVRYEQVDLLGERMTDAMRAQRIRPGDHGVRPAACHRGVQELFSARRFVVHEEDAGVHPLPRPAGSGELRDSSVRYPGVAETAPDDHAMGRQITESN
ncbi:hypothetical protein GCM10022222_30990 [Amycolatopsis ultiminotia]|uniref:Uncharacterized protein n=1 Tax=Amycolatopsis ultiminotia TaxID=543629 RepID=A0ABP6W413_9PSEU